MKIVQTNILLGHNAPIYDLIICNEKILSIGGDGFIVEWDPTKSDDGVLICKVDTPLFSAKRDADTGFLWVGDMNGGLYAVDPFDKKLIFKQKAHEKGLYALDVQDSYVYTTGGDGMLKIWNKNQKTMEEKYLLSAQHYRTLDVGREGVYLAGGEGKICCFDTLYPAKTSFSEVLHESTIFDLSFSDKYIFSASRDAQICRLDKEFRILNKVPAHLFTVNAIAFNRKNGYLLSASRDRSIKLWDEHVNLIKVLDQNKENYHLNSVNKVKWLDENRFASVSDDRTIRLWEIK